MLALPAYLPFLSLPGLDIQPSLIWSSAQRLQVLVPQSPCPLGEDPEVLFRMYVSQRLQVLVPQSPCASQFQKTLVFSETREQQPVSTMGPWRRRSHWGFQKCCRNLSGTEWTRGSVTGGLEPSLTSLSSLLIDVRAFTPGFWEGSHSETCSLPLDTGPQIPLICKHGSSLSVI